MHYKEYLVGLINKSHLDPVYIMNIEELTRLIERDEKTPPQKKATDRDSQYRKKLIHVGISPTHVCIQILTHGFLCSTGFLSSFIKIHSEDAEKSKNGSDN